MARLGGLLVVGFDGNGGHSTGQLAEPQGDDLGGDGAG